MAASVVADKWKNYHYSFATATISAKNDENHHLTSLWNNWQPEAQAMHILQVNEAGV